MKQVLFCNVPILNILLFKFPNSTDPGLSLKTVGLPLHDTQTKLYEFSLLVYKILEQFEEVKRDIQTDGRTERTG